MLPLVWERHTRPLEARKGHRRCTAGMCCLEPECADGFTDDVESVVAALLAYRRPIMNLEGWITARMANAIKDGYRMRRSRDMGAQQRVRVPVRLAVRLGNDPWMVALADRVLQWAGVRCTAGTQLWPLGAWAEDRAALVGPAGEPSAGKPWRPTWQWSCGPCGSGTRPGMRATLSSRWAASGRRSPRRLGMTRMRGAADEAAHLELVPQHERDDAQLAEAAAACLVAIRRGIAAGGKPRQVVAHALAASFLSIGEPGDECHRTPFSGGDPGAVVAKVLADPDALDRVVATVLDMAA